MQYEWRTEFDPTWRAFAPLTIVPAAHQWTLAPDGWEHSRHHDGRRWLHYRRLPMPAAA